MDDVAGCRLIFSSTEELKKFRETFHGTSRFNHKRKNNPNKYDYIAQPKPDGYRGIHDIYEYDVRSKSGRDRKGLLIELQYRTIYQHAWATSVELVGYLTEDQPKFGRGNDEIKYILRLASEIIGRAFESMKSCLPDLEDRDVVEQFTILDNKRNFMSMLRGLSATRQKISDEKDIILIFGGSEPDDLEVRTYPSGTQALRALFELEQHMPEKDIVLVRGNRPEDVREAFKNYFSDAQQFVHLIDEGCRRLVGDRIVRWTNQSMTNG